MRLTELAKVMDVTPGRLSQLRSSKEWPPKLALAVEAATDGAVDAGFVSPVIAEARAS